MTATGAGEYLSIRYSERLVEAGLEPSVGSVGDSSDNALSFMGRFQLSNINTRPGPGRSPEV